MNNDQFSSLNRRQFLRGATAGVALFHMLPGRIMAGVKTLSPNEKLNVAGIGIGGQGGGDIDAVAGEGSNLVALCDVDENYAAKKFAQYPKARQFKDFRVIFDKMDKEIELPADGGVKRPPPVTTSRVMTRGATWPLTQIARRW